MLIIYLYTRKPDETISTYLVELCALAEHYNFRKMIHDRLVCGINEVAMQKHLLAEGDKLIFAKAVALAQLY